MRSPAYELQFIMATDFDSAMNHLMLQIQPNWLCYLQIYLGLFYREIH